ncbi:MAG TPA: hypothetical protein VJR04_10845 [Terriglobales bacterium]|nr:hypothetical protein [Terriglobales bacterium]
MHRRPTISSFFLLIISALLTSCTQRLPDYPPSYREYAYVTNGKSNSVSVLDTRNFRPLTTIPVGTNPTGVAINPKKNEVYVVNTGSSSLSVIGAEQNNVVKTISLGKNPYFIDVAPDGTRAYVANSGSNTVSILDLGSRRVLRTIAVGNAPGVARVSPDGKVVVVAERLGNSISVIDAVRMVVRSSIAVCKQPTDVQILPDSSKAFIACSSSAQVAAISLNVPSKSKSDAPDRLLALLDVGTSPVQLALKPDGGEIFVSNFGADTISEIATNTNEVGGSYVIGAGPVRGLVSADNTILYVSNFKSDTVGIYSIDDGKALGWIQVGSRPDALALSPNQNFLFVVDTGAGDVSVIRTSVPQRSNVPRERWFPTLTIMPVGEQPNAIAIKAFISSRQAALP